MGGHDDGLAGADEVAGETFDGFGFVDEDFVEREGVELGARRFVKGFGAVGDGVVVDDGEGEVEVVKKGVGVAGGRIEYGLTGTVELGDGVELDEFEIEGVGYELLGGSVGAIAGAS